ncbi:MAG: nitroreductase family protein [Candidatus Izemoplasmatales bacterium]|jgi:nitroreductase|nr:nitroreductase family protein [Candidatus Izemoplasmatales bacterium]MDD3865309.1 nitroreductase family protein [Candidatus Izemoplasmatales bacterium]
MKNQTIDLILQRRSVREFTNQPIEAEKLKQIVECGIYAPTARNKQNWHFTVITNPETIDEINRLTFEGMQRLGLKREPDYHVFYHAPAIIIMSSLIEGFSELNCGCAIENMAIAAKSLGIDSCIVGQTRFMYHQANAADINRMLKIPEGYEHDAAICFGYRHGENPEAMPRKEGVVDYIK